MLRARREISRRICNGDHKDGHELMLRKPLLPHASWPLNVRIAAVFNDMGEVRRALSKGWGCLRIYQLWLPSEDRQSGKKEMPGKGGSWMLSR